MTTLNGLPAHILLVHVIVVLLPLAALLLVLSAVWPAARRKAAGANALLSLVVLALVPVTTNAGEWLQRRVASTDLVRAHTELGDTAIYVAVPVAVLALVVWWREREAVASSQPAAQPSVASDRTAESGSTITVERTAPRRTILAPGSALLSVVIAVLSVVAAGAVAYDIYRIGDSGAQAAWQGQFTSAPAPGGPGH
jgi:hypothetical protein